MRFWTSRSERSRRRARGWGLSVPVCALILAATVLPGVAGPWTWRPRLDVGGGWEDDRVDLNDPSGVVVPGGGWWSVSPSLEAVRFGASGAVLRLAGQGVLQEYTDARRRLLAGRALGEWTRSTPSGWRWRVAANGGWFDDDRDPSTRRLDGTFELGVAREGDRWRLEALTGGVGRRHPEVVAYDARSVPGTDREAGWVVGAVGTWLAGPGVMVRAEWLREDTSAYDPLADAVVNTGGVRVWWRASPSVLLSASAVAVRRSFTAFADQADTYRQGALGVERHLGDGWTLYAQGGYAEYRDVVDRLQISRRVGAGVRVAFGVSGGRAAAAAASPVAAPAQPPRADVPVVFRLHAPGAGRVALVGDFNGWDPGADPLQPVGGGWWRLSRRLPAGEHAYGYLVDGVWRTPPDAERTVDDGFGGRNGLIEVAPAPPVTSGGPERQNQ